MARGILSYGLYNRLAYTQVPCRKFQLRLFSSPAKSDDKAKVAGIPYKNLTIGVPKEKWTNERRYAYNYY